MPPSPLTPTLRYFPPGTRKTYWVVTISNYNAPTRGELNAGVDLSAEIQAVSGWSLAGATVDTPDMGQRFTTQVPGRQTAATNDLTVYTSSTGNDARAVLVNNTNGYIVQLWEGDVTGQWMDVFPVRIMSQAMDSAIENAGAVVISFAVTRVPAIRVAIP